MRIVITSAPSGMRMPSAIMSYRSSQQSFHPCTLRPNRVAGVSTAAPPETPAPSPSSATSEPATNTSAATLAVCLARLGVRPLSICLSTA